MSEEVAPRWLHPLQYKTGIVRFTNWERWRQQWEKSQEYDQLLSLLHTGFDQQVTQDQWKERIAFYLSVADGHDRHDPFCEEGSVHDRRVPLCHELAQKAWKVLAHRLFKDEEKRRTYYDLPSWFPGIMENGVREHVLEFFRIRCAPGTYLFGDNIPRKDFGPEDRIVRQFIQTFVSMLWRPPNVRGFFVERGASRAAQPALLEIMLRLGTISEVLEHELEPRALRYLSRIAHGGEPWCYHEFHSLDHAVAEAWQPAIAFLALKAKRRHQAVVKREKREEAKELGKQRKQQRLQEAARRAEEAQRELEKLRGQ